MDRDSGSSVAVPLVLLAAGGILIHLAVSLLQPAVGYEFHRDELLYLAMGKRLEVFGMEASPGIAIVAGLERGLLGDSILAIRLAPALAGGAMILLTGLIARELKGGRFAQVLAALSVLLAPVFLRSHTLFQPVVFDQLAWVTAAWIVARIAGRDDPRGWLPVGAVLGLGILFKPTSILWGFALFGGLLVTHRRRDLKTPWPWLGGLATILGSAPAWIGQIRTGWPFFAQTAVIREAQVAVMDRGAFLFGQLMIHWPAILLAIPGLWVLMAARQLAPWRILGVAWLIAFAVLLGLAGKAYYLSPAYPPLLAAGAVCLEARTRGRRWIRPLAMAGLVLLALPVVPFGLPILPPPRMAAYAEAIGIEEAVTTETGRIERLPQDYADMVGWREQAETVAGVWRSLPVGERRRAILFAGNYGEAGALDLYGPDLGLPEPVSNVSSFHRWGVHGRSGEVAVVVGVDREDLEEFYARVVPADTIRHPWAIWYETDLPVWVARSPRRSLAEAWDELREP